ncbi:MAG: SHOCT domain-containing protein [Candidatus Saccharimonadales bacterium]
MLEILAHANNVSDDGFFNHMMDGGHWSSDGGFTVLWMLFIMLIIVAGAAYLLARAGKENIQKKSDDPISVAKSRYAKGDISKEQFDEIKKNIT